MGKRTCNTKARQPESTETGLAVCVAPEDLQRGDFVAILSVTHEFPSFFWSADYAILPRNEPVRVSFIGADGGVPLKIQAVCLPFVFVKDPSGKHRHLDTRLCRLVRLSTGYAKRVRKTLRKREPKDAVSRATLL